MKKLEKDLEKLRKNYQKIKWTHLVITNTIKNESNI